MKKTIIACNGMKTFWQEKKLTSAINLLYRITNTTNAELFQNWWNLFGADFYAAWLVKKGKAITYKKGNIIIVIGGAEKAGIRSKSNKRAAHRR
jgi:hypothetical protein